MGQMFSSLLVSNMSYVQATKRRIGNALSIAIPALGQQADDTAADDRLAFEIREQMCCIPPAGPRLSDKSNMDTVEPNATNASTDMGTGASLNGWSTEVNNKHDQANFRQTPWSELLAAMANVPVQVTNGMSSGLGHGLTCWNSFAAPVVPFSASLWSNGASHYGSSHLRMLRTNGAGVGC